MEETKEVDQLALFRRTLRSEIDTYTSLMPSELQKLSKDSAARGASKTARLFQTHKP
jgi:hypothetical protein